MPDIPIVTSFLALLQAFSPHFTAPTFRTFLTIASGWVLALGRHTVTATVRAANAIRWKHIVIDALWYVVAGADLVRMIVVRDFPGHERDDVFG